MFELPQSLRNRFHLYLNVLPVVDAIVFYGLFIGGIATLVYAISRVSVNISSSMTGGGGGSHHKANGTTRRGDQYKSNVYMPCEEKLIPADLVKCPGTYLDAANATELHNINDLNLTAVSYELENELPLIEDGDNDDTSESEASSEADDDAMMVVVRPSAHANSTAATKTASGETDKGDHHKVIEIIGTEGAGHLIHTLVHL